MLHTAQLILHLTKLGFAVNWKKSNPIPHQQVQYLGMVLDAGRLRATLSEIRQASLLLAVRRLRQGATVTALTIMQTLGLMAAAHSVVQLGLLHMRRLQRWFAGLCLDLKRHMSGNYLPLSGGQPPVLGVPSASPEGSSAGASDLLHHGVHRCIRDRMGGGPA